MTAAPALIRHAEPRLEKINYQLGSELSTVGSHIVHSPLCQLLQRRPEHRNQDEVTDFSNVVPNGTTAIFVLVIHQAAKIITPSTSEPAFLQRHAVIVPRAAVHSTNRVRSPKPFVRGAHHRIRLNPAHVEGHSTDGLGSVHYESRANVTRPGRNGFQVEAGAVGPVNVGHRNDSGVGIDGFEQRGVPALSPSRTRRSRNNDLELGTGFTAEPPPRIHMRRKLIQQSDHVLAVRDHRILREHRYAIRHRRNDGYPLGVGYPDQFCKQPAHRIRAFEEIVRRDVRRYGLSADSRQTGCLDTL